LRYVPGWYLDETMWVREGEVKKVPETPYYIKNERFDITFYDEKETPEAKKAEGPVVKKYETKAVLYEKNWTTGQLTPVTKGSIIVNHPLAYKDLRLVQADFRMGLLDALSLKLVDKESKQTLGTFTVDLYDIKPNQVFRVADREIVLLDYYPDFALENNQPITKSPDPIKPAFVFEVREKGQGKGERSWVISGQNLDALTKENRYAIDLAGMKMVNSTGLMVRVDKSLPVILFGGVISMIGLVMGFYWHHRRVWARAEEDRLYIGAHTNKNWYSLERELKLLGEFDGLQVKRN
jgi:cytochrome c biogenesis protein